MRNATSQKRIEPGNSAEGKVAALERPDRGDAVFHLAFARVGQVAERGLQHHLRDPAAFTADEPVFSRQAAVEAAAHAHAAAEIAVRITNPVAEPDDLETGLGPLVECDFLPPVAGRRRDRKAGALAWHGERTGERFRE